MTTKSTPANPGTMYSIESLKDLAARTRAAEAEAARLRADRDRAILALRLDNHPWGKLQEATGISRAGLDVIAARENGGERPVPRQRA